MKRYLLLIPGLVMALAPLGTVNAAPLSSVDQWIEQAMQANATLGAQRESIAAAIAVQNAAGTWEDPILKYGVAPQTLAGPNTVGHRFEISQKLPWPDQLSASEDAAIARVTAARHDTRWQQRQLIANVKVAYGQWWYISQALGLHHETRALLDRLATITEQRLAYGYGAQSQTFRIETELDTLDAQLVELEAEQSTLSASLIPLLGGAPGKTDVLLNLPSRAVLQQYQPDAREHPFVASALAREKAARADLERAEVSRRPTFTANVGYNSLWADEDKRWVVGVGVQIPFSGQRQDSAVRQATATLAQDQWRTVQRQREWQAALAEFTATIRAGYQRLDILKNRHLPNQNAEWDATLNELASGTARLDDAIESALRLTQLKLTQARVRRGLYSAIAQYQAWLNDPTIQYPLE